MIRVTITTASLCRISRVISVNYSQLLNRIEESDSSRIQCKKMHLTSLNKRSMSVMQSCIKTYNWSSCTEYFVFIDVLYFAPNSEKNRRQTQQCHIRS